MAAPSVGDTDAVEIRATRAETGSRLVQAA